MPRTLRWPSAAERVAAAIFAAAVAIAGAVSPIRAQDTTAVGPYARALATWIALVAAPGYEQLAMDRVKTAVGSGWSYDRFGNLIKRVGEGSPHRVIACGLDESGYVVSEITDDGYLRVHMDGNERHAALWDQYHEGQRVIVLAVDRTNPLKWRHLPGVFAVRSNHLWRRRALDESPATIENLWIDVGARSRAEAERMGIAVLDPVVRDWPEWTFADYVAGPGAANRAGCAAVATAGTAARTVSSGETDFIISVQKSFTWSGLTGALATLGRVDSVIVIDDDLGRGRSNVQSVRAPWPALARVDVGTVAAIGIPTRFNGTLAEAVREQDLESLQQSVARASATRGGLLAPIELTHGWTAAPPVVIRDSLSRYADLLGKLTDIYAVSGNEAPMRDAIQQAMPAWARDSAVVDSAGNLVLAMGPDRDTSVFIAHMDEIGFLVTRINRDGTVALRTRGTFFPHLWEGQPALLHRPDDKIGTRDGRLGCAAAREGPLRGIFIPRDSATQREPNAVTAWFGLDSAALVDAGVRVGMPLTSFKCSARVGDVRLTARSVDDRAGDVALLLALSDIDPAKLDHKVFFVWSVREEGGLEGAKALAATLGPSVHRVHAIDTFVSSDSPLESERFARVAIGTGAVVRALDNSSVTPPEEIDRLVRLARANGIPLQVGVTNGGNDGSELARLGAIDAAIAWPLRYSHSPAEVIDLRDLRSLTRIVTAAAKAPTRPASRP